MSGPSRNGLLVERGGGAAGFRGEAPATGALRPQPPRWERNRQSAEASRRHERRAARCSLCGARDHRETPLLPLPGGWSCGACLGRCYDAVLRGERLPEPPRPVPEPVPPLTPGPSPAGTAIRRTNARAYHPG